MSFDDISYIKSQVRRIRKDGPLHVFTSGLEFQSIAQFFRQRHLYPRVKLIIL